MYDLETRKLILFALDDISNSISDQTNTKTTLHYYSNKLEDFKSFFHKFKNTMLPIVPSLINDCLEFKPIDVGWMD
jgi:hypothetical protein